MEEGRGAAVGGVGVNYDLECQLCPDQEKSSYIGETSRNLYTRSKEHLSRNRSGTGTSFMLKHQASAHQGEDVDYRAKITASTRDCLTRQVKEAVLIRRRQSKILNSKTEWH